ncbi:MAG: hypothetical protein O2840_02325 [bacterium]|nr:hypothetical protein [bacterium]
MPKQLPVLSIFGPTGAGKTAAALDLANKLIAQKKAQGVDIISADSRQVYADIPILSGADVPVEFVNFTFGDIALHGIGILKAHESWSLGQFQTLFQAVYDSANKQQRAVIVVGGTALYHKQLLQRDPHLRVQPNAVLRAELESLTVEQLQERVEQLNSERLRSMNDSDRANPRRLVRAIEQESSPVTARNKMVESPEQAFFLVTAAGSVLEERIAKRVQERFVGGAVAEVEHVLQLPSVSEQLRTACGFAEITQFLAGEVAEQTCLQNWTQRELQYSKSQKKWNSQFPAALTNLLQVLDSVY